MKASYLLNLILIVVIIVMAFLWFKDRSRIADLEISSAEWLKIDSLNSSFESRADTWPAHANEGGTTIDARIAEDYIQYYQRTTRQLESNSPIFSQSIWVDAGSLSSMMKTIIENKGDGIRVYFSRYPPLKSFPDNKRTDGGAMDNKNSIVIFTTKPMASGDINALHQDVFYIKGTKNTNTPVIRSLSTAPSQGYNYDGTCPPNTCSVKN